MGDDYKIILGALLDENSVANLRKQFEKEKINLPVSLNLEGFAKEQAAIKKQIESYSKEFQNVFKNLKIDVSDKESLKYAKDYYGQQIKLAKSLAKEQEKLANAMANGREKSSATRAINDSKKQAIAIENERKAEEKLANTIGKRREQTELLRKAEEKRANIKQSSAMNKALDDEYKLVEKIKKEVNSGKVDTQVSTVTSKYNKLAQVTDVLKTDFSELKLAQEALVNSNSPEELKLNYDKLIAQLQKVKTEIADINSKDLVSDVDKNAAITKFKNYMVNNSNITKEAKNQLQEYIATIQTSDNLTKGDLKNLNMEFSQLDSNMRSLNRLGLSLGDAVKAQASKFTQWISVTGMVMSGVNEFRQGVSFIKDMSDALNKVNYTMNVTSDQLKDIGDASLSMAKDLKTSALNVLDAVATYANANETAENILEKARPTIMLSNVTGMDTSETTDILQGTLEQFNLAEDQVMHVADVFEKVSQGMNYDFSRGIKEISEGIQASGEVADDAGFSIENYTALLGTLIAKTRSGGSELGRSLRTMMVRTTKASSSALAGGEVSEEDISKAETALRRVGIEVRKDKDTFRDFEDIMTDLYNKVDSLSQVDLSNIAYEVASTRQVTQFRMMVKAWGDYQNLAEQANESSGTVLVNQNKYAKSLTGQLGELKAVGQNIWSNILDSDVLKDGVSTLTNLLDVIDKLTSALGGFGTVGTIGAGILGAKGLGKHYCFN